MCDECEVLRLKVNAAENILRKTLEHFEDIAWGTQVWIANEAEQVINFGIAP